MNTFENRQFIILNVSELSAVNFNEVLETSPDTVLKSVDGTKTFVKWDSTPDDDLPSSLQNIKSRKGPYTHSQMLEILQTNKWKPNNPLVP